MFACTAQGRVREVWVPTRTIRRLSDTLSPSTTPRHRLFQPHSPHLWQVRTVNLSRGASYWASAPTRLLSSLIADSVSSRLAQQAVVSHRLLNRT
jgi:hypothetical protein